MNNTFLFALNAVLPLVILIALGYALKCIKIVSKDFFKQANKLVFKLFLPVTLFLNIYKLESIANIDLKAPLFALGAVVCVFFLGLAVALIFFKDNREKGAVWQGIFRSNYAILGIPLAGLILGDAGTSVASILSAVVVPAFNILAVVALSVFNTNGEKPNFKKVLLGICKNPLIHGVLIGILFLLIRFIFVKTNVSFRLTDVQFLYKSLTYVSNVTTPLSLIVLGGQFEFGSFAKSTKAIIIATFTRLIVVPGLVLTVACLLGFRGAAIVAFIAAFGSPVAVSSAIMAQEMGADGELAGSLVVSTTIGSVFTLTIIIAIVKSLGMI